LNGVEFGWFIACLTAEVTDLFMPVFRDFVVTVKFSSGVKTATNFSHTLCVLVLWVIPNLEEDLY